MKTLLTLSLIFLFGIPHMHAVVPIEERGKTYVPGTTTPHTLRTRTCTSVWLEVIEPYYSNNICPLAFTPLGWEEIRGVELVLFHTDELGNSKNTRLAEIPVREGLLKPKFECHECMEGNWEWKLDMVDKYGISRASLWRDCMERLHVVCNDLQINLPDDVRTSPQSRKPVGDIK